MLKTFLVSYKLKNTYLVNGFIWRIKSIPLVGRLVPSNLYGADGLKVFWYILGGIFEFYSIFFKKAFYMLIVFLAAMLAKAPQPNSFFHILLFFTLIGGFVNTRILDPSEDKYYAIFLMRLDSRRYVLTDYAYFLAKAFLGFLPAAILFGLLSKVPFICCLAIPFMVVSVKLCFTAVSLISAERRGLERFNNVWSPFTSITIIGFLAACALPFLGFSIPIGYIWPITALFAALSLLAASYIIKYPNYRRLCKCVLRPEAICVTDIKQEAINTQKENLQKHISLKTEVKSTKTGYRYFNELFVKRHSKLLISPIKWVFAIAVACFGVLWACLAAFPDIKPVFSELCLNNLPPFLFVMYLINRGQTITQAMFYNCDHSMLRYSFFRKPKAILLLFTQRLKYIALLNLMPALIIAIGLPITLYISGGTDNFVNYILIFTTIISMSVFFSVHSMVLYYLLQPYNVNLESKSFAYSLAQGLTYLLSYFALQMELPTLYFGICVSLFCVVYIVVALVLAYRLAPKTFKLK